MNLLTVIFALAVGLAGSAFDTDRAGMQKAAKAPKTTTLDAKALNDKEFQSLLYVAPMKQQLKDDEYAITNLTGGPSSVHIANKGQEYRKISFKTNETKALGMEYVAVENPAESGRLDSYKVQYKHRYVLRQPAKDQVVLQEVKN